MLKLIKKNKKIRIQIASFTNIKETLIEFMKKHPEPFECRKLFFKVINYNRLQKSPVTHNNLSLNENKNL